MIPRFEDLRILVIEDQGPAPKTLSFAESSHGHRGGEGA